jgi:hypothetical protein
MTRVKLNAIESGKTKNPALEDLVKFSGFFKISIDSLLRVNLSKLPELQLRELEAGNDVYTTGRKIRVLAISTDKQNNENIEYVPVKARMGYRNGYNDPEYIATLAKFSLPNLPKNKTFRIFPSTGESMLPLKPGTDLITEYVENWEKLKDTPCVLILKSAGTDFVFKCVTFQRKERNFLLCSLNEGEFPPYTVPADEVLEVWKYFRHIENELPKGEPSLAQLSAAIKEMRNELKELKN